MCSGHYLLQNLKARLQGFSLKENCLLQKTCDVILHLKEIDNVLRNDGNNGTAGVFVFCEPHIPERIVHIVRHQASCLDIFYFVGFVELKLIIIQTLGELENFLQGADPFRVLLRGRRVHHTVLKRLNTSNVDLGSIGNITMKDTFAVVGENDQQKISLWISCFPLAKRPRERQTRRVNEFSTKKSDWLLSNLDTSQHKYGFSILSYSCLTTIRFFARLCNGDNQSFFSNRNLVFSGIILPGPPSPYSVPLTMASVISKHLGAQIQIIPNFNAMDWSPETGEPIPDTILGQVLSETVDLGSNQAIDIKINPYSDEAYYLSEPFYFVNQKPEPLLKYLNLLYPFDGITWNWMVGAILFATFASVFSQWLSLAIYYYSSHGNSERFVVKSVWPTIFLPLGILFGEHHFNFFLLGKSRWQGVLLRSTWVMGALLVSMSYQANLKVNSLSIKCVNNSSNALKASLTRKSFEDFPETLMEILDRDGKIYAPAFPKEHYMHTEFDRKLYERMVEDNTMLRYFVQVLFAQGKDVTLPHVHFFSNTTHMQEQSQRIHDGERAFYQINYYSWVMQRGSYHRVGKDYPLKIVKETYVPPSGSKKMSKIHVQIHFYMFYSSKGTTFSTVPS